LSIRANINQGVRAPETVHDLITRYTVRELTAERKSDATLENYRGNLDMHILPKWGGSASLMLGPWQSGSGFALCLGIQLIVF